MPGRQPSFPLFERDNKRHLPIIQEPRVDNVFLARQPLDNDRGGMGPSPPNEIAAVGGFPEVVKRMSPSFFIMMR